MQSSKNSIKKNIIIYGAGPFAELMLYHFSSDSHLNVTAFCIDQDYRESDSFCNLPLVSFEETVKIYPASDFAMFVAIGYRQMRNRKLMFDRAKLSGYHLVNFISSNARLSDNIMMGENNIIQSSCDIEPFVQIGHNNIFWTGSIVGHNAIVGNHNYISGGCGIGGNCTVGDLCFMGNAALMVNDINIADETYMISGSIVLKNTKKHAKYHGNPSKLIGFHQDEGIIIKQ